MNLDDDACIPYQALVEHCRCLGRKGRTFHHDHLDWVSANRHEKEQDAAQDHHSMLAGAGLVIEIVEFIYKYEM